MKWFRGGGRGEKRADFLVARVFQHWARGLALRFPYPENNMAIVLSTPKQSETSRVSGSCEKTKPQEEPVISLKVRSCPPVVNITVKSTVLHSHHCCCSGGHLTRRKLIMRSLKHKCVRRRRVVLPDSAADSAPAGWRIFWWKIWKIGKLEQPFRNNISGRRLSTDKRKARGGGRGGPSSPRDDGDDSKAGGRCRRWRR